MIVFVVSCGTLLTILYLKISREPLPGFLRRTFLYPTRSSLNDDFYTEHSRLEKMRSSFLRVGPKIWNSLPSDMRNLPKSTFRKKTRNKLFEILSKSDDYLAITEIMHQLKFD